METIAHFPDESQIKHLDHFDRQAEAEGNSIRRLNQCRPAPRPIADHRRSITLRATVRVPDFPSLPKAGRGQK